MVLVCDSLRIGLRRDSTVSGVTVVRVCVTQRFVFDAGLFQLRNGTPERAQRHGSKFREGLVSSQSVKLVLRQGWVMMIVHAVHNMLQV